MEGFVHIRFAHDGGEERVQRGEQAGIHSGDDQHGRIEREHVPGVREERSAAMVSLGGANSGPSRSEAYISLVRHEAGEVAMC